MKAVEPIKAPPFLFCFSAEDSTHYLKYAQLEDFFIFLAKRW